MPESSIQVLHSSFASHRTTFDIGETKYSVRILKMNGSTLIYIGVCGREFLDEIGIAMPCATAPIGASVIGTVALGPQLGCDSEQLSLKLAKRLNKPVYVSCNVPYDRMIMTMVEKKLIEIIQANPELV